MEAWPNHQGFDYAAFPIHQQGQLTIFHDDSANEEVSIGIGKNNYDDKYIKDEWFFKGELNGRPVTVNQIDPYGQTPDGKLERLNAFPGVFWMVWSHWFPETKVLM